MTDLSKITDFKKEIYTIGYNNLNIENFIKIINQLEITVIVDVRQYPYSTFNSKFNEENLKRTLKPYRIYYRHYPELGEKQKRKQFYDENNIFKFKWYTTSIAFKNGIEKINNALKLKNTVCLMGYTTDPIYCHRSIMIGKYLYDNGYEVKNIITKNNNISEIETQQELNNRILQTYEPLIKNIPEDNKLDTAYDLINKTIGYKSIIIAAERTRSLFAY